MKKIFRAYGRLLKSIAAAFSSPNVLALMSVNVVLISLAATFYWLVEGWSFLNALYFSVITISTVGYGDLTPVTFEGKIFTIGFIVIGIGIFVLFVGALAEAVIKNAGRSDDAEG
jgi:voltage-gated potassium channel